MAMTAEWLDKDYYRVLGVEASASDKEITRAYRRLARELHPDTNPDAGDGERFREVTSAYEVLHDPARRREYDEVRRLARTGRPTGGHDWPHGQSVRVTRRGPRAEGRRVTVEDLFGHVTAEDGGWSAARPRRGADLETSVELPFEEAVRGTTRRLRLGARSVTARIPPGIADGQTVRLAGRGQPGENGVPPGDLVVRVRVAPHPYFRRDGRDLALTVPVTFPEAALGADVRVPTIDRPVTVRVPPGTRSGTTFRVHGRGVPAPGGAGDLLVTVDVDVPRELDERQRAAVQALAAAIPGSPRAHLGV
ncbi:DnaJ C-terminal domain-containing protein [Geodermatophilus sp. URMC 64]